VEVLLELRYGRCIPLLVQSLVFDQSIVSDGYFAGGCVLDIHEYDLDLLWYLLRLYRISIQSLVHPHHLRCCQGGLMYSDASWCLFGIRHSFDQDTATSPHRNRFIGDTYN